jgi:DNA-binding NarL/FixJ family response regulator
MRYCGVRAAPAADRGRPGRGGHCRGRGAAAAARGALRPDVVLTDIRMPPTQTTEGLQAAVVIRRQWPGTGVVVLSQHVETEHLFELLADDPRRVGYVLKERVADVPQFTAAIAKVATGESVIDPEVVARLIAPTQAGQPAGDAHRALAGSAGPDGQGQVQSRDRGPAVLVAQDRGDPCREHVRLARPAARGRRSPQGARGPDLPAPLGSPRWTRLMCAGRRRTARGGRGRCSPAAVVARITSVRS